MLLAEADAPTSVLSLKDGLRKAVFVRYLSVSSYAQFWANRSKWCLAQHKRVCFLCQVDGMRVFFFFLF